MSNEKNYIIFGAGYEGRNILHALGKARVKYFCDNYSQGDVDDIPIINLDGLKSIQEDFKVIIGVQNKEAVDQIKAQLSSYEIEYIMPEDAYRIEGIDRVSVKHDSELDFWKSLSINGMNRSEIDTNYRNIILSIAEKDNDEFLHGKVVADFGCGPMGSLNWLKDSTINIGIDVLAAQYTNEFGDEIVKHRMVYVTSGEKYIPIPDNSVDCLITVNSLDHVLDLKAMCNEIIRIMKPGALLIGSFNLFELESACEPQTLTENILNELLFSSFSILTHKISYAGKNDKYEHIVAREYIDNPDGERPCVLWTTAIKKT